jgi:glucose-6-phosphate 1-dehydrogenase
VFYCAINSDKIPFSTNVEILTSWMIFNSTLLKWANNNAGLINYEKGVISIGDTIII